MRVPLLALGALLASSVWAQLPLSFTGTAGDACIPAQDPFIQAWPGTAAPAGSVRFAWSVTNTEANPVQLEVQVVRDQYGTPPATVFPALTVHTFNVIAAPNTTTTGESFWTCAPLSFQQGLIHSVRVFGPSGTCTAFSLTVEESLGVFQGDPEPNNSSSQPTILAAGVYQEGRMNRNSVSDQDWYRLQLPENGTLRIEFEGEQPSAITTYEMQFQLSFTTSTVISTNSVPLGADRVPVSSVIEIPCRGSGGVYNLRLTNVGACDISYRFRYVVVAPVFGSDPEPNNGSSQAVPVGYDTQRVGQLNHDFDGNLDVYRIDPPLNGVLSIDVEAEHSGATPSDMQVVLQNSAGTVLATWNPQAGADGNVVASELNYNCLGNTVSYYLSFSSSACGTSYRWKYTVDQPAFGNDVEPNQSTSQAILLPLASAREGQVNFFGGAVNDNTDFYRIEMPGNGILNLTVEAEHAGASTTETMQAQMLLSTGSVLATWNAPVGAASQATSTTFQLLCQSALQPLFLRLQSSVCGTSYRVSWTYTPSAFANDIEPNNGASQAVVLPLATTREGGLNFQGADNIDFLRMDMPGNGILSLTVEAEHAGTSTAENLEARISISNGAVIATWNAPIGAGSQPTSTTFTLPCQSTVWPLFLRLQSSVCGTSYRVSWTYTPPVFVNDAEPNNSVGSGTNINLNSAAQDGQIGFEFATDADVYHFTHPGGPWSVSVNAEHAGTASGTMTLELYNNFSLLQTYTVNVGGSSTPLLNTFSLPNLNAGTLYRLRFAPVTCGVSYRILCYDDDNDGTCNAFDLCAGGPEPDTPCDDGTACTINDVIQPDCGCAGTPVDPDDGDPCTVDTCDPVLGVINTFQDSDADGTCDANDVCASGPEPGQACDDGNAATINDVVDGNCTCAGTLLPGDCLGVPGGSALPGTPCNDNSLCTTNDTWDANCNCVGTPVDPNDNNACTIDSCDPLLGVIHTPVDPDDGDPCTMDTCDPVLGVINTFQDSDSDGTCDANDVCPGGPEPGTACDDGNAGTINDVVGSNCVCAGTPVSGCTEQLVLNLTLDAFGSQTTWTLIEQGTNAVADQGGPYADGLPGAIITGTLCVPVGCYRLVVNDAGGDGIAGGGYVLRTAGTNGQRILDNSGNGAFGSTSAVIGNGGFCLPLGTDKLIFTSCDKLDWVNNQFIVAAENPAVSAQFGVTNTTSGYQFWWFDPNGSYGYTKFRSHATSDGFGTGATRACHARINNWSPNQIPANVLMNVKVRGRVNGVNGNWGPVCRFKIDPVRAACPLTKLMDLPGNAQFSCGVTRTWGGGSLSKVVAKAVDGATQYQFRWSNAELATPVIRTTTTPVLQLNWTPELPNGTYQVQVRAFKNGQWCATSLPWGDVCNVTITGSPNAMQLDGGNGHAADAMPVTANVVKLFPNPNNGQQLTVSLSAVEQGLETVAVDIFDRSGARVSAHVIAVNDGMVYQMVDVAGLADGLYLVHITAGGQRYTERLVIAK